MGAQAEAPPLPALEILDVPDAEVKVALIQRDCNYLQALEGDIDTSHFGFLHAVTSIRTNWRTRIRFATP